MAKEFSGIVKNSLYAMVDLFLDYVKKEDVDSQRGNIYEFIIDCANLNEDDPEYHLLLEKFQEEFEESGYFSELEKSELIRMIEDSTQKLTNHSDVPVLILGAVNKFHE